MLQPLLMAIGAGLASAVLFVLPAKGGLLAVGLGVLAPLPLLIVSLGNGERFGALGALMGVAAVAIGVDPLGAAIFGVSVATPALGLAHLARLPGLSAPGTLILACAALAAMVACVGLALQTFAFSSFDVALDDLTERLTPLAERMIAMTDGMLANVSARDFARWFALAMTPAAAGSGAVGFAVNLWLAGRVTEISGQLGRPWQDIPTHLRLPRAAFVALGVSLALCLAPGLVRVLAATASAGLLAAFAMHGLAALHGVTRGRPARPFILGGFYALCLTLFPWPLLLAACLGLTDLARPFRRVAASPSQP